VVRRFYPLLYASTALGLLGLAYVGYAHARTTTVIVPIVFDTPYTATRTVVAILVFAFFCTLMLRHTLLCTLLSAALSSEVTAGSSVRATEGKVDTPMHSAIARRRFKVTNRRALRSRGAPRSRNAPYGGGSSAELLRHARSLMQQACTQLRDPSYPLAIGRLSRVCLRCAARGARLHGREVYR